MVDIKRLGLSKAKSINRIQQMKFVIMANKSTRINGADEAIIPRSVIGESEPGLIRRLSVGRH